MAKEKLPTSAASDPDVGTAADVEAIMKKYDRESNTREFTGLPRKLIRYFFVAFSLYCVYMNLFATWDERIRRTSFLGCIILMVFVLYPARKGNTSRKNYIPWYDIALGLTGAGCFFYYTFNCTAIIRRSLLITNTQVVIGLVGALILIEACRRVVGIPILCVAGAFIVYSFSQYYYLPMFGLTFAFKKINYTVGVFESPWVGLDNFTYLFKTSDAFVIFRNTLCYNLAFIVLGTILAIVVAIFLEQVRTKMLRVYQTSILIPYLLSITVVSYLAFAFLSSDNGFINNSILKLFGMDEISWYSSPKYWPFILTFIYLWKSFGYSSILYFATLIGIDDSYYEAAVIDGASTWQQIRHITLPCLKTTIITLVIMHIGRMFYSDFGLFYQVPMNNGLLFSVTNTIDTYVYRGLLQLNDVGRSSAAGFLQSILGFVLVMITNMITRKIDKESALF